MLKTQKNLLEYFKTEPFALEETSYESALGMFSFLYATNRNIENNYMRQKFHEMDAYLQMLPQEAQRELYLIFVNIYLENEKIAYQEGMRLGYRLAQELEKNTECTAD